MSFKRRAGSIPALGTEKASPVPWGGFCHLTEVYLESRGILEARLRRDEADLTIDKGD